MIRRIIQFLFSPIKVQTAEDCQRTFDALCERAYRDAVASVSRGNVNLAAGSYLSERDMQERCANVLSKLEGL